MDIAHTTGADQDAVFTYLDEARKHHTQVD